MRKIAYIVGSIILTGCGGGGGSPSPSPIASNTPISTASAVEQPYFTEVQGAFPDPTNHYWFFNLSKPSGIYAGQVTSVEAVDLNNDGSKELIMVIYKGIGHDQYRGMYVGEPCKSTTIIYTLNGDRFSDVSDMYLDKDRDFKACIDSKTSVVDINNDNKKDFFYSANQEDGRNPNLGSLMHSQLVGWVSQPDGKYKIMRFGPEKWYHSIGHGIDDSGNIFVTGAGFPNNNVQNSRYIYDGRQMMTVYDQYFPNISPASFVFMSKQSNASDTLIQQTFDKQLGAVGYYKENMIWYKTEIVSPQVEELGEETFEVWSKDTRKVKVLKVNGKTILGTGGGSNLENLCQLKLYKDQSPVAAGTYTLAEIPNYTPGKLIKESEVDPNIAVAILDIKDKKLSIQQVTIKGETNFAPGRFQCIDINNDGYDDITLGLGNDDDVRHQRIYVNQKDGTFKKLDLGSIDFFSLSKNVDMYGSVMADFDNDGKVDIVVYPSNHTDNSSLSGSLKFYRGNKSLQ